MSAAPTPIPAASEEKNEYEDDQKQLHDKPRLSYSIDLLLGKKPRRNGAEF
jgi:hypothetical protein